MPSIRDSRSRGPPQTGTGKTGAFAIPILQRLDLSRAEVQALVLTPNIARIAAAGIARIVGAGHRDATKAPPDPSGRKATTPPERRSLRVGASSRSLPTAPRSRSRGERGG